MMILTKFEITTPSSVDRKQRNELGLLPLPIRTRVYPSSALIKWPKSDISDFGVERGGVRGFVSLDRPVTPPPGAPHAPTSPLRGEVKLRHVRIPTASSSPRKVTNDERN